MPFDPRHARNRELQAHTLQGKRHKPYYWSNTKTPSEIDFIIQDSQRVIPVEVKAEENVRARSLAQFIKDNPGLKGLRISMKGYVDQEWMENIPIIAIGTYFEK